MFYNAAERDVGKPKGPVTASEKKKKVLILPRFSAVNGQGYMSLFDRSGNQVTSKEIVCFAIKNK